MQPVGRLRGGGRQAWCLAEHERALLGETRERGVGEDIDGGRAIEQLDHRRQPVVCRFDPDGDLGDGGSEAIRRRAGQHGQRRDGGTERSARDPGRLATGHQRDDDVGTGREWGVGVVRDRHDETPAVMHIGCIKDLAGPPRRGDRHEHQVVGRCAAGRHRGVLHPRRGTAHSQLPGDDERRVPRAAQAGERDARPAEASQRRAVTRGRRIDEPGQRRRRAEDVVDEQVGSIGGHDRSSNRPRIPSIGAYDHAGR